MSQTPIEIVFQPEGKRARMLSGSTLLEAASRAGMVLDAPCGGNGSCGKCRIRVEDDSLPPTSMDRKFFDEAEIQAGWRLACAHRPEKGLTVFVPTDSRLFEQKILMDGVRREVPLEPNIRKTFLRLAPPSVEDQRADLDRLSDALDDKAGNRLRPSPSLLRKIPEKLRRNKFEVTLVTEAGELIAVESGDSTDRNYGAAFDLGTTTVVGTLINLATGEELATAARGNPQTVFGDDVVSRIQKTLQDPEATAALQRKALDCIDEIIHDLCRQAGIEPRFVYEICVAGNTAMTHLLHGIPPLPLASAPYVGALRQSYSVRAEPLGLSCNHHARLCTLPNIAGFVGGDTVAVILSSGMDEAEELTLAVDIGTNGEIVLGNREGLVSCSTAAGPAFEGARIAHGMRAADGAIDKVRIREGQLEFNVLGENAKARGLCGTGLIDAVAQLLEHEIIDAGGRITAPETLPDTVGEDLRRRVIEGQGGYQFVLADETESQNQRPVCLTQSDIRELQLAKGAIMAGINLLARQLGVEIEDVRHVLLAGAFGNYINPRSARRIGLIPDLPAERLQFIGNAASAGARMAIVSRSYRERAETISLQTRYVEMAGLPEFQEEYMMQMMFLPVTHG